MKRRLTPSPSSKSTSSSSTKRRMASPSTQYHSSFLSCLPAPSSVFTSATLPETYKTRLVTFYLLHGRDSRNRTLDEIINYPDHRLEALHDYIQWLFPLPETSPFNLWAPVVNKHDAIAFRECRDLRIALNRSFVRMLKFYGFEMKLVKENRSMLDEEPMDWARSHHTGDKSEARPEDMKHCVPESTSDSASNSTTDATREKVEAPETAKLEKSLRGDRAEGTSSGNVQGFCKPSQAKVTVEIKPLPSPLFIEAGRNWWRRFDHNHLRITRIIRSLRVLGLDDEAKAFHQGLLRAKELYRSGPGETSYKFWERAVNRPLEVPPEEEEEEEEEEEG